MANESGEFNIPTIGYRSFPQATAFFNDQFWVIGAGHDNSVYMEQSTLSLVHAGQTIVFPDGVKEAANWTTTPLTIPGAPGGACTRARCSATPLDTALVLFWSNLGHAWDNYATLLASRYSIDESSLPGWGPALTLQDTSGAALQPYTAWESSGDVVTTAFNNDTVIVASPCLRNHGYVRTQHLYVATFNIADIDPDQNTWRARSEVWIPVNQIDPQAPGQGGPQEPGFIDSKLPISIEWFTSAGGPDATPPFWLWVAVSLITGANRASFCLPVDAIGNVTSGPIHGSNSIQNDFVPYGTFVVRDPAGRIRTYFDEYQTRKIVVYSYSTYHAVHDDNSQPILPSVREEIATITNDGDTPSVTWYTDTSRASTMTIEGKSATVYPVWEFIVYPAWNVLCQVRLAGYAQVIEYPPMSPVPPENQTKLIIAGIIDGPIPVPNANLVGNTFNSTQPDFGVVTYSARESQSTTHSVSNSWMGGFKSEGGVTKGAGPAWNVAVSGGPASTHGTTENTSTATARIQHSLIEAGVDLPKPWKMLPLGTIHCAQAVIHTRLFRFVDPNGNPISDGLHASSDGPAPHFVTVQTTFADSGSRSYVPYAVVPGDLTSYTPERLNDRMQKLGYGGRAYFQDVVIPHAYTFGSGESRQPYLQFDWNSSGGDSTAYEKTVSTFSEQGWSLDASVYVGVSGGEDISIFGFGEAASFQFLVGGTFSTTTTTITDATHEWGIAITAGNEGRVGPPYPMGPDADPTRITSYSFRLYFLPPPAKPSPLAPNYWVTEIRDYAKHPAIQPQKQLPTLNPDEIDQYALAWKIMFVVTAWTSLDGKSYVYTG